MPKTKIGTLKPGTLVVAIDGEPVRYVVIRKPTPRLDKWVEVEVFDLETGKHKQSERALSPDTDVETAD